MQPPAQPSPDARGQLTGRLLDGRYRIGPRIARGGMASVYEATDVRLERPVAVKVMHPGLGDDEEFAARFVREARHAARLSHPNIVGVTDQGEDDGTVFLVMEYVPGHTLRDVIRKEAPMPPERALELMEPVLSALAAAHRAGLIHRDVKPENVLIAAQGTPYAGQAKVADFGLARAVSADTQHTVTGGVLIGTVSYLAPELVVEGRADARADVYAAGVLLYELLTGRKPHEGDSPIQVAYKHVHDDVPAPSTQVPGIPDYVDALVARATARDRGQRPADAAVLLHQVHRVAQALREGLDSDPELADDLAPVTRSAPEDTEPQEYDGSEGTAEQFDPLSLVAAGAATSSAATSAPASRPVPAADPGGSDQEHRTTAIGVRPEPPSQEPPGSAVPPPARRRRRGPLLLLLALLLAAGGGAAAWWFGWERWTPTPGVLRMTQAEATQRLDRSGLDARLAKGEYSETVPKGEVLESRPAPGENVLDGGTVTLVLSLGKERYDVPPLKGMTEDEAQDALAATNLAFGDSSEVFSEKVPEGQVVRSEPKVGTTLRPDSPVDLVLSKGRKPVKLGDWEGKSVDRARQVLEKRGLVVKVTGEEFSDTVEEGDILTQSPTDGPVFKEDTVEFTVSKGPELVEMPDVLGNGVDAARSELQGLGFRVQVRNHSGYLGLGFVFQTDPGRGEMVPKGSTITLYLV